MDGHFGNYPGAFMVRQANLHLISKLRCNAALYLAFVGEHSASPGGGVLLVVHSPAVARTATACRQEIY